jgi:hypothetical protein
VVPHLTRIDGDPDFTMGDDTMAVLERFRLAETWGR